METPELEQFFRDVWQATTKSCIERQEPADRRSIRSWRTLEEVKEHIIEDRNEAASEAALQELSLIAPRLVALSKFSDFFAERLGASLDPKTFWGLLGLALTLALQFEDGVPMRRLAQMLRKLSHNTETYQAYFSDNTNLSKKERESCFEIFTGMTSFLSEAVLFLHACEEAGDSDDADTWKRLTDAFEHTNHEIEESLQRLEKLTAMSRQQRSQDMTWLLSYLEANIQSTHTGLIKRFNMMPPVTKSTFFDRDNDIAKIEEHFMKEDQGPFRSVTLYGMAGVGKTHVAMKYAQKKFSSKEADVVLWVASENIMTIKQSFTDMAKQLKLPDAKPDAHDDNRLAVLTWLQHTPYKWVMVYDNVKSLETLLPYWPNYASTGQALITTTNSSLAFEPADGSLEIESWDIKSGSQFLLHLLSGHISSDILTAETKSALELSERLSGHALALSKMAGLIHRRCWKIQQLVEVYDSQPAFKDGLDVIWNLSFQDLHPNSATILSVLVFCGPDSIPISLFQPATDQKLPDGLEWFLDDEKFSEALEELQTLTLVRRDRDTQALAVHRLIQTHFAKFIGDSGRQLAFHRASELLYSAFPQRDATKAQMFDVWERCSLWAPHVIVLKDRFRRELKITPTFRANRAFCELLVTCQRFTLEQHAFTELEDMVEVNGTALKTLDEADQTKDMISSLPSHLGQMQARLGLREKALESALKSHEIRLKDPDADLREVAWAEHNIAQVETTFGPLEKALKRHQDAVSTWRRWEESQGISSGAPPPVIQIGLGRCYMFMKRFQDARQLLQSAFEKLREAVPLNWAMAAAALYAIGRLDMQMGDFKTADAKFFQAQKLWYQGDKAKTDHLNGALVYRMACCAMQLGRIEAAENHLRDAMLITGIHKDYMVGEHARCLYKLSQILAKRSETELESRQALQEAQRLYSLRVDNGSLDSTGNLNPTEEDYDRLVYCIWR